MNQSGTCSHGCCCIHSSSQHEMVGSRKCSERASSCTLQFETWTRFSFCVVLYTVQPYLCVLQFCITSHTTFRLLSTRSNGGRGGSTSTAGCIRLWIPCSSIRGRAHSYLTKSRAPRMGPRIETDHRDHILVRKSVPPRSSQGLQRTTY